MRKALARAAAVLLPMLVFSASAVFAQSVAIGKRYPNGSYSVVIDGVEYLAITRAMVDEGNLRAVSLESARKEIEVHRSLVEQYEDTLKKFEEDRERQDSYTAELVSAIDTYRKLVGELKKAKKPFLVGQVGAGFSGTDYSPVLLGGVGLGSFMVWGFAQEDNPGVLVGLSMPIF